MVLSGEKGGNPEFPNHPALSGKTKGVFLYFLVYVLCIGLMGTRRALETTVLPRPQQYDTPRES